MDGVKTALADRGVSVGETRKRARDRNKWRSLARP